MPYAIINYYKLSHCFTFIIVTQYSSKLHIEWYYLEWYSPFVLKVKAAMAASLKELKLVLSLI